MLSVPSSRVYTNLSSAAMANARRQAPAFVDVRYQAIERSTSGVNVSCALIRSSCKTFWRNVPSLRVAQLSPWLPCVPLAWIGRATHAFCHKAWHISSQTTFREGSPPPIPRLLHAPCLCHCLGARTARREGRRKEEGETAQGLGSNRGRANRRGVADTVAKIANSTLHKHVFFF